MNDTHCNSHCSGNNKQFCGGYWKMGIFSTGITGYNDLLLYIILQYYQMKYLNTLFHRSYSEKVRRLL